MPTPGYDPLKIPTKLGEGVGSEDEEANITPDYMKIPDGDLIIKSLPAMQNRWITNNGLNLKNLI